jgi:hypothetical protein
MRKLMKLLLVLVVVFMVGAQFVPVELTNPPTGEGMRIEAPAEVMAILERACFDCHSNETVWPWYAHIAPASWLLERDVVDGRDEMNLSEWGAWSEDRRAHKAEEMVEEIEDEEMPPWFYTPLHPAAKVTEDDVEVLESWGKSLPGAEKESG